jgi:nucleolar protein 14
MNPERAALLNGTDNIKFNKEYDLRLRQMAQDKRSKPTEKSKTEEQVAEETARKLQELEAKRLRRMQGASESSDEEVERNVGPDEEDEGDDFGLGAGIKTRPTMAELGVEDEDDFLIDDDLVANISEEESIEDESDDEEVNEIDDEEDDEFVKGLLTEEEAKRPEFLAGANAPIAEVEEPTSNGVNGDLAYKFSCPQSHDELLEITKGVNVLDFPTVVQRIRALYHPKLSSQNKGMLENFAVALVDHISYLTNQDQWPPFVVLESIIRHIHSLAKTFPVEIANAFRRHLKELDTSRALSPNPGDLILLTAVGTIFPTSDHFHQVVTPAILSMGRYLGLKIPQTLSDYATGAYLCALCLQYQKLSKRYIPEVVNFIENTLCVLAPSKFPRLPSNFPYHEPKLSLRIVSTPDFQRQIKFHDCVPRDLSEEEDELLKAALVETNLRLLDNAADMWTGKEAFTEVFQAVLEIVQYLSSKKCRPMFTKSTQVCASSIFLKLP